MGLTGWGYAMVECHGEQGVGGGDGDDHRSGAPTLMRWGAPAPSWCGHNSLGASEWGGWVQCSFDGREALILTEGAVGVGLRMSQRMELGNE